MKTFIERFATPGLIVGVFLVIAALECLQFTRLHVHGREIETQLAALRSGPAENSARLERKIAEATANAEREVARLAAAEHGLREAEKALPNLSGHELRSHGHFEAFGLEAAGFIEELDGIMTQWNDGESTGDQAKVEAAMSKMLQLVEWAGQVDVIAEMEDRPGEIARFHAATIQKRLNLDGATTSAVRAQIEKEFTSLAAEGLTGSKCPTDDAKAWRKRRDDATKAAARRVESIIPADRRREWVVEQSLALGVSAHGEVVIDSKAENSMNFRIQLPGMKIPQF